MHLLSTYAITSEDFELITKLKKENTPRGEICSKIVIMIDRKHTLKEFITALENTKAHDRGHEEIVKIIKEEQEKREASQPHPEKTNQMKKSSDPNYILNQMPTLDLNESELPNVDDEPEGPYFSPRVRTMSGASNMMTNNDNLIPPTEPAGEEVSIY